MTAEELAEFKAGFPAITNRIELREWFLANPELTLPEACLIAGMSEVRLKYIKRSIGLSEVVIAETSSGIKISRESGIKKQPLIAPLEGREEWVVYQTVHKKRSITELSKAVGRSRTHIRTILRNHLIKLDQLEIHPCKTREWLMEHFVNQKLSYHKCGAIAGVSRSTIRAWLINFGIKSRDRYEASYGLLGKKTLQSINTASAY